MKRFIPLLALFAAGVAASFALASPPGKGGPTAVGTTTHGNSGSHSQAKCHPVNLKGTVAGTVTLSNITHASGPRAQQITGATFTLNNKASVQAWLCTAAGATSAPATPTLFLRQLRIGGSPQAQGTTTTTSSP
jgi:hypothetical protein